jgi:hypothetical protein
VNKDPFADLNQLRLDPEVAATVKRAGAKQARARSERQRERFVMVPWSWIKRLKDARRPASHMVGYFILYQHWKTGGQPVPVTTVALRPFGISRWAKWRALKELEQLGLVRVQRGARCAPLVTVL